MKKRIIPFLLLIAYTIVLIKILVFKDLALIRVGEMRFNFGGTQEGPGNFIPFKTILPYLQGHYGSLIAGINIIGNIIALVPLGFLVPLVFPNINFKKTCIISIAAGLIIECTQAIMHIGIFDIDDVILNGLGVVIGFWKFKLYNQFSKTTQTILSTIILTVLALILALYTLSYYKRIQLPIGIEPSDGKNQLMPLPNSQDPNQKCCDLCNGTGGTGVVIGIGNNTITIKRRDGKNELIKLTKQTTIKTSAGPATNAAIKMGDHVTVVIDETETASLVIVCGIQ